MKMHKNISASKSVMIHSVIVRYVAVAVPMDWRDVTLIQKSRREILWTKCVKIVSNLCWKINEVILKTFTEINNKDSWCSIPSGRWSHSEHDGIRMCYQICFATPSINWCQFKVKKPLPTVKRELAMFLCYHSVHILFWQLTKAFLWKCSNDFYLICLFEQYSMSSQQ